jgi:hypothetical protein
MVQMRSVYNFKLDWCPRLVISAVLSCIPAFASATLAAEPIEFGKVKPKQLNEISGIASSRLNPRVYWLHNDGDSGKVFAVRANGKLAATIDSPVPVEDVEDIAIGPGPAAGVEYLYLGDIGDNNASRQSIQVVRFPEPNLAAGGNVDVAPSTVERIRLEYPDGPHVAESLLVDPATGSLFVVTKEPSRARLYEAPATELTDGATVKLRPSGTLAIAEVSAGAISPDGKRIVLRQEADGWLWERKAGQTVAAAVAGRSIAVPVRGDGQGPNGEAVSFSADSTAYVTVSEGKKQAICEFPLPAAVAGE